MTTFTWIVGRSGLLGGAVAKEVDVRSDWVEVRGALPWGDQGAIARTTTEVMTSIGRRMRPSDRWAVIWAAGAGVTSSDSQVFENELLELGAALRAVGIVSRSLPPGVLFFASSAGGAYGGSRNPPFNEATEPLPLSDYGRSKLLAESLTERFGMEFGVSVVNGRIANLYGPGQRLDKAQGLISHLARAQYTPAAASIYVPLDTRRDYIYIGDCAALLCDVVVRALHEADQNGPVTVLKNLATGRSVTIADLLGHFRRISKRHPHVMLGSSAQSALQATDLRLNSIVWTELDQRDLTTLPAGIRATMDDILRRIQDDPRSSNQPA